MKKAAIHCSLFSKSLSLFGKPGDLKPNLRSMSISVTAHELVGVEVSKDFGSAALRQQSCSGSTEEIMFRSCCRPRKSRSAKCNVKLRLFPNLRRRGAENFRNIRMKR